MLQADAFLPLGMAMGITTFGLIGAWYVWPWMQRTPLPAALIPLLLPHGLRYIGLSFLISMAELAGVPTPLARSFMSIGSAITGEDFMRTGRTRQTLGIDALGKDELLSFLAKGFA